MGRKGLLKPILGISFVLVLVVLLTLKSVFPQARSGKSEGAFPSVIGMSTLNIGSSAHVMAGALGEVLKEKTGRKMRIIPVDAEVARLGVLRSGDVQFAINPGSTIYMAERGLGDFAKYEWGVLPLQMAWLGPAYLGVITTNKHQDINTIADLKGKRVAVLANESAILQVEGFLAFGNIGWGDIKKVTVPGYVQQFKALLSGTVDVVPIANPVAASLYELAASPGGLKWISFPQADKDGWKRLQNLLPWGKPAKVAIGVGIAKEKPLEAYVHALAFVTYEATNPELVYLMAKTIGENLERLHKMTDTWAVYTINAALDTVGFPHVYHQGAIRYFKEKGLWTRTSDDWNRLQSERQSKLKAAWSETLNQASSMKWSSKKLKDEWYLRQVKITGFMPPLSDRP